MPNPRPTRLSLRLLQVELMSSIHDLLKDALRPNEYGAVTLGQLIDTLAAADQGAVVWDGFGLPGSWRGVYEFLAFRPKADAVVADMLRHARSAVGATFQGYKGGDFTMTRETPCFIAEYGCSGDDDAITPERLEDMLGVPVAGKAPSHMPTRPFILERHTSVGGEWCIVIPDDAWSEFKAYVCALESIAAKAGEGAC